jgi:hypothetical protein
MTLNIRIVSREQYTDMYIGHVGTGQYYWKLAADGPLDGYPKLISNRWPGLPDNVDAAAAHPRGTIYFFKDDKTWAYRGLFPLRGYPKLISVDWKGIPNNVDAAMYYEQSTFFFFKGKSVHRVYLSQCFHLNQLV